MKALSEVRPHLGIKPGAGWALVLDADRTLGPIDTGRLVGKEFALNERIRVMFLAAGYTRKSFEEHTRIWSEIDAESYLKAAKSASKRLTVHPVWRQVLSATECPVAVVTAGIPQVWRSALANLGISALIFGGLHKSLDPYFVTPNCKAWVVCEFQRAGYFVVAAGDSEIDLPMLKASDAPLWVPDALGSPRLHGRLGEIPGVQQVAVDHRRFPPFKAVDADAILKVLRGDAA